MCSSDLYEARINSYWSASARQHPACIVEPKKAGDLATPVRAIAEVGVGNFAVRSGGHSHWAGGSNVEDGVTLDLGNFNKTTYDSASKIASLGPAQRWGDVFLTLEALVIVPGGRDGSVGAGGLLTGGGNSYYPGRHGSV